MKNILKYIAAPILLIAFFACEEPDYTLSDNVKYIAFDGIQNKVAENTSDTLSIPVYLTTTDKSLSTLVGFEILQPETGLAAIEGEDFEILNQDNFELNGSDIFNYLQIVFMNNDSVDGDKSFIVRLASSTNDINLGIGGSEKNTYTVTILDDEHPLAFLMGDYTVDSHSDRTDENVEHDGVFLGIEGSTTELYINGLWTGSAYNLIHATVNLQGDSIIIEAGQVIATDVNYGHIYVTYTYIDENGERFTDKDRDIVGIINEDNTVTFNNYGFYVESEAATGYFEWFDYSTWTKK